MSTTTHEINEIAFTRTGSGYSVYELTDDGPRRIGVFDSIGAAWAAVDRLDCAA